MISLISPLEAQKSIAKKLKEHRLQHNLTQEGLSKRSGVPVATLRKFEREGIISLESLVKLMMVLGVLDRALKAVEVTHTFQTIDEVIKKEMKPKRKRG